MRKTNLKAVPDSKPAKLSYEEIKRLSNEVANEMCQELETVNKLLILTTHMMAYSVADGHYVDDIAMSLSQSLYNISNESLAAVIEQAEEYRRRIFGQKGAGQ